MPTFREAIRPIVAIIVVSIVLTLLLIPLGPIEWTTGTQEVTSEVAGEGGFSVLMIIGPLIKITFLMGIPALITLGVRKLIGRSKKS